MWFNFCQFQDGQAGTFLSIIVELSENDLCCVSETKQIERIIEEYWDQPYTTHTILDRRVLILEALHPFYYLLYWS